jgi:hypothetical protein
MSRSTPKAVVLTFIGLGSFLLSFLMVRALNYVERGEARNRWSIKSACGAKPSLHLVPREEGRYLQVG